VEPDDWFYKRVWSITLPDATNTRLKMITVTAIVKASAAGGIGLIPQSTLSVLKTDPF
jgi:hypothetical protein